MLLNQKNIKLLLLPFVFLSILGCNENIKKEIKTTYNQFVSTKEVTDTIDDETLVDSLVLNKKDSTTYTIDSTKNYVYLTFDDGPYQGSEKINKIIKEENVKATVFIVGANAYTDKLKQNLKDYQANDLIEISNHTYSHAHRNKFKSYYNHPEWVLNDVKKNDSIYKFNNRFVRLPGRNVWRLGSKTKNDFDKASKISSDLLAQNQYYIFGWDYEWNKISKNHPLSNPEDIYKGIVNRLDRKLTFLDKHLVILMHDDMFNNDEDAEKLRTLIRLIKSNKNIILEVASNYPVSLS